MSANRILATLVLPISILLASGVSGADETKSGDAPKPSIDLSAKLNAAAKKLVDQQTFAMEYKLLAGEEVRWTVTHLATVDTKIKGSQQTVKSRSISHKVWKVKEVDDSGNVTFVQQVDKVDMWQSVSGREEVRFNSETDKVPPREYEQVAKSIGIPLATITINKFGRMLKRENAEPHFKPGVGELTIPLPEQPVRLNATWRIPEEVRLQLDDGRVAKLQTQQVYTLDKVEAGLATISMRTEVITPVNDPKIEAQLVDRLKNGTIKFDMDAGRIVSKQMDLNKEVVGFSGAESLMQYLARFTEELVTTATVASKPE